MARREGRLGKVCVCVVVVGGGGGAAGERGGRQRSCKTDEVLH